MIRRCSEDDKLEEGRATNGSPSTQSSSKRNDFVCEVVLTLETNHGLPSTVQLVFTTLPAKRLDNRPKNQGYFAAKEKRLHEV